MKTVQAGVVVSITEDFLTRGQDELLREFISRLNRVGENVSHTINFADYDIPTDTLPSSEVTIS